MSKPWSARFETSLNPFIQEFNASIEFDKTFIIEDIDCSIAHARMLGKQEVITQEESNLESLTELGFSEEEVETLVSNALKSKDDIAELAVDELQDIIEITEKKAADIIMKARESWFN